MLIITRTTGVQTVVMNGDSDTRQTATVRTSVLYNSTYTMSNMKLCKWRYINVIISSSITI